MSTLVSQQELDRRRKLRAERVKVADKHNVAIGFIDANGKLMKQANGQPPPQLPKRSKEGQG